MAEPTRPRWLVFGIGNPSRGDDALGFEAIRRLEAWLDERNRGDTLPATITTQTDFQCQIEHALDLLDVHVAIFVDATIDSQAPFTMTRLEPARDATHTTHALSPAAVLDVARRLGQTLPECWILAISGQNFELGAPLSPLATANLDRAFEALTKAIAQPWHTINITNTFTLDHVSIAAFDAATKKAKQT